MASEVKKRLLEFLKYKNLTQRNFAKKMGVSDSYIGAMRSSLSAGKVEKLKRLFPELSIDWLLYGEDKMLKERGDEGSLCDEDFIVPLLPVAAFAGNLQMWSESVQLPECEKTMAPMRGVDFAIRISGDSMEPRLHNGSMLYIKRINDKAFVPWGNIMVIDTENGVLVKSVYPVGDDPDAIEARSINPDYPPIRIPSESIYGMYRILGTSSAYSTM